MRLMTPAVPSASGVVLGTVSGRIALQTNRDGNVEIYVMNGDGSGLTDLTDNPAGDWPACVVAGWEQDPLWERPGRQPGNLCHERGRQQPDPPDGQPGSRQ